LEKCFISRQGYSFSSLFAQNILFGTTERTAAAEYEVITYPSIVRSQNWHHRTALRESWNNFAIVPSFFDKYEFYRVHLIKTPTMDEVISADLSSFQFLLVGYRDPDYPGIVRWKRPEKRDMPKIN
jgi:hypothetical protein